VLQLIQFDMKQEGPKEIVIPEQKFLSCYGCDFHKSQLVKSGRDPEYSHNCTHPKFPTPPSHNRIFSGNLKQNEDGHIVTPRDCPFIPKEERDTAGTPGHGTSGMFQKTQIDYDGQNKGSLF
jgi:hypothetical protein